MYNNININCHLNNIEVRTEICILVKASYTDITLHLFRFVFIPASIWMRYIHPINGFRKNPSFHYHHRYPHLGQFFSITWSEWITIFFGKKECLSELCYISLSEMEDSMRQWNYSIHSHTALPSEPKSWSGPQSAFYIQLINKWINNWIKKWGESTNLLKTHLLLLKPVSLSVVFFYMCDFCVTIFNVKTQLDVFR